MTAAELAQLGLTVNIYGGQLIIGTATQNQCGPDRQNLEVLDDTDLVERELSRLGSPTNDDLDDDED